ncbi:hypothetical protein BU26DRAFT_129648 [Trematosphaeria pertusa]|uniref:Uncharacterized protein n=1 Tax=Trematosphaeria pertusa TaxID=390896 RepID=A0A6A6HXL1_9PLEO|nr:uncharacterized protein BU26DRAFT_129648 [Trematosphaeria pertusa]KAF2242629.1 hypothetical protein BU26DRAFT_129648 [Trematosphaeria pertusa]
MKRNGHCVGRHEGLNRTAISFTTAKTARSTRQDKDPTPDRQLDIRSTTLYQSNHWVPEPPSDSMPGELAHDRLLLTLLNDVVRRTAEVFCAAVLSVSICGEERWERTKEREATYQTPERRPENIPGEWPMAHCRFVASRSAHRSAVSSPRSLSGCQSPGSARAEHWAVSGSVRYLDH